MKLNLPFALLVYGILPVFGGAIFGMAGSNMKCVTMNGMDCDILVARLQSEIHPGMPREDAERILDTNGLPHRYDSRETLGDRGETPFKVWQDRTIEGRVGSSFKDRRWPAAGTKSFLVNIYIDQSQQVRSVIVIPLHAAP